MNSLFVVLLILLIIVNACLIYLLYQAWNWRKRLNDKSILLPDQFYKDLEIFNNNIEKTKKELESLDNSISDSFQGFNSTLSSTVNKNAAQSGELTFTSNASSSATRLIKSHSVAHSFRHLSLLRLV